MSRKEFLYAIKKDIEENLPLEAEYDNEEVPGLRISLLKIFMST